MLPIYLQYDWFYTRIILVLSCSCARMHLTCLMTKVKFILILLFVCLSHSRTQKRLCNWLVCFSPKIALPKGKIAESQWYVFMSLYGSFGDLSVRQSHFRRWGTQSLVRAPVILGGAALCLLITINQPISTY